MVLTELTTAADREEPVLKKFRVQLDFNESDFQTINDLVKDLNLPTRAELFRSAILVLQWMIEKKQQGYAVVATDFQRRFIEPEFAFLRKIKAEKAEESQLVTM